ncbi:MAG: hypothetical protein HQK77_07350 [Desulfobacterales bacterium]|nr:hypothetical protein [Desulfobacterales bacterium]
MPFKCILISIYFLISISVSIGLLGQQPCLGHASEYTIEIVFFYSSESSINNFKTLKITFDEYLNDYGSYTFQPFGERPVFEHHFEKNRQVLLLLSVWHYRQIYTNYHLKPLLVGTWQNKKYQRIVLSSKQDTQNSDLADLDPLASANSIQHTQSVLFEILKTDTSSISVLMVPKDIDALISVGLGIAKSAISTESSLKQLEQINPLLYKNIKIIGESNERLRLVLSVPVEFNSVIDPLLKVLRDMSSNPKGRIILEMIGLDGFQEPDDLDLLNLE